MALMDLLRRRSVTNRARWAIDNLLPPVISDARWFNRVMVKLMYGDRPFDLDFKEKAISMSAEEFAAYFRDGGDHEPYRDTDTTPAQRDFAVRSAIGRRVLEVGCGNGAVALALADAGFEVVATDLKAAWLERLSREHQARSPDLRFEAADALSLPYQDASFDTVVSTHTLEHIPDLRTCLREMRRVARERLVIVVPCQRYKRYTIDTHVHFFPTEAVLRWSLGLPEATVEKIDGDWALYSDLGGETGAGPGGA